MRGAVLFLCASSCDWSLVDPTSPTDDTTVVPDPPNPELEGVWTTLPYELVRNPIGAALLHGPIDPAVEALPSSPLGKIYLLSGSGDDPANDVMYSSILELDEGQLSDDVMPFDAFCAGLVHLADGNVFVAGGTIYDPNDSPNQELGLPHAVIYDVDTRQYLIQPDMAHGRWYPTTTLLPDGRVMTDAGWDVLGMNSTVEFFTPGVGWTPEYAMGWEPMFYPRQHVLPNGLVFKSSPETESLYFDPSAVGPEATGWRHAAWTRYGLEPNQYDREYGSSVLLGLYPEDGYAPRVIILGGNRNNPTDTTEIIDLSAPVPSWQWGPDMVAPRVRMNAALLPDGRVLVLGGSSVDVTTTTAVLDAEIYDPDTNAFTPAGRMAVPHMDHAAALLLPDGAVWVAGNQGPPGPVITFESRMEIYQPPYLFDERGDPALRPVVRDVPAAVTYGEEFTISVDAPVRELVLMRPGAVTHSFDVDQRLVGLVFEDGLDGTLTATAPPDANVAPPGYYMLFALDAGGVPSVADFVLIR